MIDKSNTWLNSSGSDEGHICNCIGCCDKCGSCRTAPWHTEAYCELLQKQAKKRAKLVEEQKR